MAKVKVGSVLHGFCSGSFGRDSYGHKRVEAFGKDWVVVRNERGEVEFYAGKRSELKWYLSPDENTCDEDCGW